MNSKAGWNTQRGKAPHPAFCGQYFLDIQVRCCLYFRRQKQCLRKFIYIHAKAKKRVPAVIYTVAEEGVDVRSHKNTQTDFFRLNEIIPPGGLGRESTTCVKGCRPSESFTAFMKKLHKVEKCPVMGPGNIPMRSSPKRFGDVRLNRSSPLKWITPSIVKRKEDFRGKERKERVEKPKKFCP